ncbi:MAG: carbohydrate kinase family protein, partial [Anaerolineae bacterium]|nr:carbohydrate kinase family protein [Anaerolineae bacterium]
MGEPVVVVVGHTCLDVIPTLHGEASDITTVLAPGQMRKVGPMVLATGGAVPNTGLALHRLGTPVRLVGKVGDDLIGRATLEIIRQESASLTETMVIEPGAASSYTVILSSPGLDRTFFHFPGPNDTFCAEDVSDEVLHDAGIFHFGYPPLMRRMYLEGGHEVAGLMRRARDAGLVTSLDVSQPDAASEAARVHWGAFFENVLPEVDIFLPGIEETLLMLDPARYADLAAVGDVFPQVDGDMLDRLASRLIA